MDNIQFEVTCPYCGQVFLVSSQAGVQVQCQCPNCQQDVIVDAPIVDNSTLSESDFEDSQTNSYQSVTNYHQLVPPETNYYQTSGAQQNNNNQQFAGIVSPQNPPVYDEEQSSKTKKLIIPLLIIALLLGGVAYWFFGIYTPKQQELADYNTAKTKGDLYAAREFLSKHQKDALPNHRISMDSIVKAFVNDSIAWQSTKAGLSEDNLKKSVSLLETYLQDYPKGLHRNEASSELNKYNSMVVADEEARNKVVEIEMVTDGYSMRSYYCNYGSHQTSNGNGGTTFYAESQYITVPVGRAWRMVTYDWHYTINSMYYPEIVLDNGNRVKINEAGSGYVIPGGRSFKIHTKPMYSLEFYTYKLKIYFHEDDA